MPLKNVENVVNLVAGIDDQSFLCTFIADNRTVATEHAHGKNFVNHVHTSKTEASQRRLWLANRNSNSVISLLAEVQGLIPWPGLLAVPEPWFALMISNPASRNC